MERGRHGDHPPQRWPSPPNEERGRAQDFRNPQFPPTRNNNQGMGGLNIRPVFDNSPSQPLDNRLRAQEFLRDLRVTNTQEEIMGVQIKQEQFSPARFGGDGSRGMDQNNTRSESRFRELSPKRRRMNQRLSPSPERPNSQQHERNRSSPERRRERSPSDKKRERSPNLERVRSSEGRDDGRTRYRGSSPENTGRNNDGRNRKRDRLSYERDHRRDDHLRDDRRRDDRFQFERPSSHPYRKRQQNSRHPPEPIDPSHIYDRIFPGEEFISTCTNKDLRAYRIEISPNNYMYSREPTTIKMNNKEYEFQGFMIISHQPINVPPIYFERSGLEYTATLVEQRVPVDFDKHSLDWLQNYLFDTILCLNDWLNNKSSVRKGTRGCKRFHIYPIFAFHPPDSQELEEGEELEDELLPAASIVNYLTNHQTPVLDVLRQFDISTEEGRNMARKELKDQILITRYTGPAYRIDDIDFASNPESRVDVDYAERTTYYSYFKSKGFQIKDLSQPLLFHKVHIYDTPKPKFNNGKVRERVRNIIVPEGGKVHWIRIIPELSLLTRLKSDVCQLGILLPTIAYHIRLYTSLDLFEKKINIQFHDKTLLKKAFTHPSYSEVWSIHASNVREAFSRVGFQRISPTNTIPVPREPKAKEDNLRGLERLMAIMEKKPVQVKTFESIGELFSHISHNERLEFLGDAVLEFICTSHLFLEFPNLKEGDLTLFRSGLVNNKFLAFNAHSMEMDSYLLYSESNELMKIGPERQHMLADCLEAVVGAIYIDQGLDQCRRFFAQCVFGSPEDKPFLERWLAPKLHPLQIKGGDRHLIPMSATLNRFTQLEQLTGITFDHIKLLIQAFTHPSVSNGLDLLDVGSNQRLEFLGDAVLQFITSRYLFIHFPEHQEGQLTLLRSALVNNKLISDLAIELGFEDFLRYLPSESLLQEGRAHRGMLADSFEAYLAALYLDKGMDVVEEFAQVVLFPRTSKAIKDREWLDPKTRLQQTVLAITKNRSFSPVYRVISESGPPHMRVFTVGAYLMDEEIGKGCGYSRQSAEQDAAEKALSSYNFDNSRL
eukprot:TRINITY_DN7160_c0_g1_i1.p1 TRINITY_DN7160_c0_g1~~TRINITY_DN7160_c0_g1_i1.p1  ORF type:complete len:1059 (-),score=222.82 TRINITY_DN7160_c0_g1_i1:31-3207(-)